jgi:hypothetical protein
MSYCVDERDGGYPTVRFHAQYGCSCGRTEADEPITFTDAKRQLQEIIRDRLSHWRVLLRYANRLRKRDIREGEAP